MQTEKELVGLAQAGDDYAFEKLVRNNMRQVYATAFAIVKNHFDADDVAQTSFIKAYQALNKFKGNSTFKTWITRITINEAKDQERRKMNNVHLKEINHLPDKKGDALSNYITQEKLNEASNVLNLLPLKQRLTVTMRIVDGLSFKEISQSMNISISSAKTNFHYGIKKVADIIANRVDR
jgi:RNA polymerase sigma-70 factor, ECF subfamily